jgi:GTPase SAR1 family protein
MLKNKFGHTAQALAARSGYHHVVSHLIRATTNQPVSEQYTIAPTISIFVLGNQGSGKSTLVKVLSKKKHIFDKFIKVKGVTSLTAGIVPTRLHSEVFGKVNLYDFAGHEEFYASHELILYQATQPLVLLTTDISLPTEKIEESLFYWFSLLMNNCLMASKTFHVIIIGSHADKITKEEQNRIYGKVVDMLSNFSALEFHGFIQCDCRYPKSVGLKQLRRSINALCRSIRLYLTRRESDYSNRLCASLMHYVQLIKSAKATIKVSELHEMITLLKTPGPTLYQLIDMELLIQTCKNCNSNGHALFLKHEEDIEESVLVLNEDAILSKVHACLAIAKRELKNEVGILEEKQLEDILLVSLGKAMTPISAIKYLLYAQFCTEIEPDRLVSVPLEIEMVKHFFFPNLVRASQPSTIFSTQNANHSLTRFFTWCSKCKHKFFTPKFIHVLFIQLVKCERDTVNTVYNIWKNGISFCHNNGTRYIIEVTDQTTRVYLAIQCLEGCESHLVKQRSVLITLIKSLVQKTCPVETEEFLLLPESTYPPHKNIEIPTVKVKIALTNNHKYVSYRCGDGDVLQQVSVEDLLYFDFLRIPRHSLHRLFFRNNMQKSNRVSLFTLSSNCRSSGFSFSRKLAKILEGLADHGVTDITYGELLQELASYSIFTDKRNTVCCVVISYRG